jgi:hypothetical protein
VVAVWGKHTELFVDKGEGIKASSCHKCDLAVINDRWHIAGDHLGVFFNVLHKFIVGGDLSFVF